jgi:hypothetical protein
MAKSIKVVVIYSIIMKIAKLGNFVLDLNDGSFIVATESSKTQCVAMFSIPANACKAFEALCGEYMEKDYMYSWLNSKIS